MASVRQASFVILKTTALLLIASFLCVLCILTGVVIWTFEVKLNQWPLMVYGRPFPVRVGDDIDATGLPQHLKRLGYTRTDGVIPKRGQWSRSRSQLRIFLCYTPLTGYGVADGPVRLALDISRVKSIAAHGESGTASKVLTEPELLTIIPPGGSPAQLCRRVPLDRMNPLIREAILVTEDTRFHSHYGIDPISIRRALITNFKAGRYVEGASTIPQQLIRMTLLSRDKTLRRKTVEIALALVADAIYSKETILEAYLNRVYLGHCGKYPVHGVAEASRLFFGKDQANLSASESALLAAIIKAPNVINPMVRPDRARSRRNVILGLMFKHGKLSREQYDQAVLSDVMMLRRHSGATRADGYLGLVEGELADAGSEGASAKDVVTYLDTRTQRRASKLLKRLGKAGASTHLILADPRTGGIRLYEAPGRDGWSGVGQSAECLLPLIVMPALSPRRDAAPRYALNSPLYFPSAPESYVTFRNAFHHHRSMLMEKLRSSISPQDVVDTLKEFQVEAELDGKGAITLRDISPMQVCRVYSQLATEGRGAPLRVIQRSSDHKSPNDHPVGMHKDFDTVGAFLVTYLLKPTSSIRLKSVATDRKQAHPSWFSAADNEGLWVVGYTGESVVVVRAPKKAASVSKLRRIAAALMPRRQAEAPPSPPEGVTFSRVCAESGLRATSLCPRVIREPFIKGTQPAEWCPLRHEPRTIPHPGRSKPGS